jgi:hypothetical protein
MVQTRWENQGYVMQSCHDEDGKRWIDKPAAIYSDQKTCSKN